ncbi:MAG: hypothetical protein RSD13_02900 [Clostridium sp.]
MKNNDKKLKKDWKQRFEEYNKVFKKDIKKVKIEKEKEVKDEDNK